MSIYGYVPKTRRAPWTRVHAAASVAAPVPSRKPSKRIRAVSKGYVSEKRLYNIEAAAFVAAAVARWETCIVVNSIKELKEGHKYGHAISATLCQVHHQRGRGYGGRGPLLRDQRFWQAISLQGHRWVHSHLEEARQRGWLCPVGLWNVPHRPGLCLGCGYRIDPSCEWCSECLCEEDEL